MSSVSLVDEHRDDLTDDLEHGLRYLNEHYQSLARFEHQVIVTHDNDSYGAMQAGASHLTAVVTYM